MNLKGYQFYENDVVAAYFNLKYRRLYIKRSYFHKLEEYKKELNDNGFIVLDWEWVD